MTGLKAQMVIGFFSLFVSAGVAQAKEVRYKKVGDPSIILSLDSNGSAKIYSTKGTVLEGAFQHIMNNSYIVRRPEGNVCPNALVELTGEKQAMVKSLVEEAGTGIRHCASALEADGTFTLE